MEMSQKQDKEIVIPSTLVSRLGSGIRVGLG